MNIEGKIMSADHTSLRFEFRPNPRMSFCLWLTEWNDHVVCPYGGDEPTPLSLYRRINGPLPSVQQLGQRDRSDGHRLVATRQKERYEIKLPALVSHRQGSVEDQSH